MMTVATIHVVDDDDSMRTSVLRLLRARGFAAEGYSSAGEFLLHRAMDHHGCILLDLRMPGPSGLDLQAALREHDVHTPVVFMTGHGDVHSCACAMRGGAVDFLEKPIEPEVLIDVIERALKRDSEARLLREVTDTIARHEGARPQGWMGAGAYESPYTPDLLKEAGYTYLMDWPMDDQPVWMRTRAGPLLSVPYPVELNDSQQNIHRKHSAREFCDMVMDQFEEMIVECTRRPLVMNVSVHPYVFGQPYRLHPLRKTLQAIRAHALAERIWFCQPREIAAHCLTLPPGTVPGS